MEFWKPLLLLPPLLLPLVLPLTAAHVLESGFAVRTAEVKKEPYSDAATVGNLPAKAPVRIKARKGGWMQIESSDASGWVRMLLIRAGQGSERAGDSGVKALLNVARTGSSGSAVATGVRGLDKEQIGNAQPNPSELQKLGRYGATRADAEQFAAGDPQLKAQPLAYPGAAAAPREQQY